MAEIISTNGKTILVDDENFEELSRYKWWANHKQAYRSARIGGRKTTMRMHRLIIGAEPGQVVDHINRNPLDNRKSNLRIGTRSLNTVNSKKPISNRLGKKPSSKYKGVSLVKEYGYWRATVTKDNVGHYLGKFNTEVEAAKAYDQKAREFFGEFANTNFTLDRKDEP